jgi:hypothetical protein
VQVSEPTPWPALLAALERLVPAPMPASAPAATAAEFGPGAPTPPPLPVVEPLAQGLQEGLAPLLQLLGQSNAQQARTGETLALLANWVREQMERGPAAQPRPRARRASTPQERALDEALMRHFYGESTLPPQWTGAADDAPA